MHCVGSPHLADRFLANGPHSCFHFLATVNDGRPCSCLLYILGSETLLLLTDLYGRPLPRDLFLAWQPAFCSEGPVCIAPSFKPLPAPITLTGKQKQKQRKSPSFYTSPGTRTWDLALPASFFCLSVMVRIDIYPPGSQQRQAFKPPNPVLFHRTKLPPYHTVTPQEVSSERSPQVVPFAIQHAQEAVTGTRLPSLQRCLLLGSHTCSRSSCACIKWMLLEDRAFFPCSFPAPGLVQNPQQCSVSTR